MIYNAQHEELMDEIVPLFEEQTGLDVELRNGKDLELANQLVAEGDDSPADVFLTENSPAMSIVDNAGLFAPVSEDALAPIPDEYVPSSGNWTGILARSTVAMYNTDALTESRHARRRSSTSPSRSGRAGSASRPPAPTSRRSSAPSSRPRARRPPPSGSRASPRTAPCSTTTSS